MSFGKLMAAFTLLVLATTANADDASDANALLAAIVSKCVSKCDFKCGLSTGYTKYIYTGDRNKFQLVDETHDERGVHRSVVVANMNRIQPSNIKADGENVSLSCVDGTCFNYRRTDTSDDTVSVRREGTWQMWACSAENAQRAATALQYLAGNARGEN